MGQATIGNWLPEQGGGDGEGVLSNMRLPPGVYRVVCFEPKQVLQQHPPVSGQGRGYQMELDVRSLVPYVLHLSPEKGDSVAAGVSE